MSLTDTQRAVVTSTVPVLREHGTVVTDHFYGLLLKEIPPLNDLFSQSAQATKCQAKALAGAVCAYAANINDLSPILPVVEKICQKHASLGITPDLYPTAGDYLIRSLKDVLGDAFTDEIRDAWIAAYNQLAPIMFNREEAIYKEHEAVPGGWRGWRKVKVAKKIPESKDGNIKSFYFESTDDQPMPTYLPGQYISVRVDVPGLGHKQIRQYSLSDVPPTTASKYLRITPKRIKGIDIHSTKQLSHPGYVSNLLHDIVNVGDVVEISHPAGEFFLEDTDETLNSPLVLISAGIGITPLFTILKSALTRTPDRRISWIHIARSASEDALQEQVATVTGSHPNVQQVMFHSSPAAEEKVGTDYTHSGRIDFGSLDASKLLFLGDGSATYFVCGPDDFMNSTAKWLRSKDVDISKVKMEPFGVGVVA